MNRLLIIAVFFVSIPFVSAKSYITFYSAHKCGIYVNGRFVANAPCMQQVWPGKNHVLFRQLSRGADKRYILNVADNMAYTLRLDRLGRLMPSYGAMLRYSATPMPAIIYVQPRFAPIRPLPYRSQHHNYYDFRNPQRM